MSLPGTRIRKRFLDSPRAGLRSLEKRWASRAILDLGQTLHVSAQDRPLENKVGKLAFADDLYQSSRFQFLHMMGKRRCAHVVDLVQLGAGRRLAARADFFQYLQTSRLSQSAGDPRKLPVCQSSDFHHEIVSKVRWVRFECPEWRCRLARL